MPPVFSEPAPDFADPLGLLRACHERMLNQCDTLDKMVAHLRAQGLDTEFREAARKVHRYFSTSAVFHHRDEEEDLFPRLVRVSLTMAELIHQLRQEHTRLDAHWQTLEPLLTEPGRIENPNVFEAAVTPFCAAYRAHIRLENDELLERARHILSTKTLKMIGKAMKERRELGQRIP